MSRLVRPGAHLTVEAVHHVMRLSQRATNTRHAIYEKHGVESVYSPADQHVHNAFAEMEASGLDQALHDFIATLSPQAFAELTALMWIGRSASDESADDWDDLVKDAIILIKDDVNYVCKVPLPEYLTKGLAALSPLAPAA
jgi:hypothetical protein